MWQRRIQTRFGLWAAISLALFVAAGCVNWVPEGKTAPYWVVWAIFLSGEYGCTVADFVFVLAAWGLLLAVPSVILGWVGQAVVAVGVSGWRGQLPALAPDAEPIAAADGGGHVGSRA